jgi:hypothetical protein
MVCNTEGLPERFVINVSEHEQPEEVVWTSSKHDAARERRIGRETSTKEDWDQAQAAKAVESLRACLISTEATRASRLQFAYLNQPNQNPCVQSSRRRTRWQMASSRCASHSSPYASPKHFFFGCKEIGFGASRKGPQARSRRSRHCGQGHREIGWTASNQAPHARMPACILASRSRHSSRESTRALYVPWRCICKRACLRPSSARWHARLWRLWHAVARRSAEAPYSEASAPTV